MVFCIDARFQHLYQAKISKLFAKGQTINILGFVDHTGCFTPTQLCSFTVKAVVDNMSIDECDWAPIKLYLWALKLNFT